MVDIELVPTEQLKSTEERNHPEIVRKVVKLFRNGWDTDMVPPILVVVRQDGIYVLNGHQRLKAAKKVGFDRVPVVDREEMRRGDVSSYTAAVRRYRKLIGHPRR